MPDSRVDSNKPANLENIVVEGEIGAGKTTLIIRLEEALSPYGKVFLAFEPVETWREDKMLGSMYSAVSETDAYKAAVESALKEERERRAMGGSEFEVSAGELSAVDERSALSSSPASSGSAVSLPASGDAETIRVTVNAHRSGVPKGFDGMVAIFQNYAAITRVDAFKKVYKAAKRYAKANPAERVIVISERSIFSDRAIFKQMQMDAGRITAEQSVGYEKIFECLLSIASVALPSLCVFLDTTVDDGVKRIERRKRPEEDGLSREYEQDLWNTHQKVFSEPTFMGAPVLRIDGAQPFHEDSEVISGIAAQIMAALPKLSVAMNTLAA